MTLRFPDQAEDRLLRFAVIAARSGGGQSGGVPGDALFREYRRFRAAARVGNRGDHAGGKDSRRVDLPRHSALFAAEGPGVVIGGESPNILVLEVRRLESGGRKDALRRFPFPPFLRALSALSANVFGGGTRRAGARVFGGLFHRMPGEQQRFVLSGSMFQFDGASVLSDCPEGKKRAPQCLRRPFGCRRAAIG